MALVGDFRQGGGSSTRGRTSTSDNQQKLNGMLHVIIPHPEKKHKDCIMCSKRNVPGGRKETTYICETCDHKPGLHVGMCFKRSHIEKLQTLECMSDTLDIIYIYIFNLNSKVFL